ncbi:putative GNAT family acetyltransferase [Xylariomycetidae sp. FL2044]|nr:putative GNAT family acetyltransferase [Xylariomycetidae sp. FL2044]
MTLILQEATPDDAARIAEIHMAAFGSNAMLLAQFPTHACRVGLQKSIEAKAIADMGDAKTTVLVARETRAEEDRGESVPHQPRAAAPVIAFAKWSHPVKEGEDHIEPPWVWPEGTNLKVLNDWSKQMEEAEEKVLGSTPSYHLSFIATDPSYLKRGAASLLLKWGVDRCGEEGVPAYLESTKEAAPFYEKHGFSAMHVLSLDLTTNGDGEARTYEEISFLFDPRTPEQSNAASCV